VRAFKEFLKPNRWKVLIIIVFLAGFIYGYLLSDGSFFEDSVFGYYIYLILDLPAVLIPEYTNIEFYDLMGLYQVFFLDLIYYYLLSCFIYFIFTKIKGGFQKKSPQTTS